MPIPPGHHLSGIMDRSKIVVIAILVIILAGTAAWSWANLFQSPDYDPEQAQLFAGYFYINCEAEHPDRVCNEVVGHHHRRCFVEQVEAIPYDYDGDQDATNDALRRRGYLECMDRAVDQQLSDNGR